MYCTIKIMTTITKKITPTTVLCLSISKMLSHRMLKCTITKTTHNLCSFSTSIHNLLLAVSSSSSGRELSSFLVEAASKSTLQTEPEGGGGRGGGTLAPSGFSSATWVEVSSLLVLFFLHVNLR